MRAAIKKTTFLFMVMIIFVVGLCVTAVVTFADSYHTIRINYVFKDGTPAHDPYVAAYRVNSAVDIEVTNPKIDGYVPMTALEDGLSAEKTKFKYDAIDENKDVTVYYLAGLTHYKAIYYKQNIYDDLYTRDNTIEDQYVNRWGYTGSNPTELEELQFSGFTNLFHEPDAIAADGSTEFRVYYDRNYYTVNFDLGEGGYGVEPVYAKYQTTYHIGEPKRLGFEFKGWVRTNEEGTEFYDKDDNVISESQFNDKAFTLYDDVIPAHNLYYKAVWSPVTTKYSIVYWMENPTSTATLEQMEAQTTSPDLRKLVTANYSVAATKIIKNVPSDSEINYEEMIRDYDFFYTNVASKTNRDLATEFPDMSQAKLDDLNGMGKFFELDEFLTKKNFYDSLLTRGGLPNKKIMGDGTTRINVYYDRKDFNLKFFYARQKISDGTVSLTNSTKFFSKGNYDGTNYQKALAKELGGTGQWMDGIADELPHIKDNYLVENGGILTELNEEYKGYRYYYYQVTAKYNEPLKGKWITDPVTDVHKKGYADREMCKSASWAVEYGTKYFHDHDTKNPNYTIKGVFERLGQDLMFRDRTSNYQELHYLVSWTNTSTSNDWNYGIDRVLNFKYQNYLELLPKEVVICNNDPTNGPAQVKASGGYTDVRQFTTKVNNKSVTKWYGLKADQIVNTIDSGNQYPYKSDPAQRSNNDSKIRTDQTAADITGFELENKPASTPFLTADNTEIDWSEDTEFDRHATINFFYRRRIYTLTFINGNTPERIFSDTDPNSTGDGVAYGVAYNKVYADGEHAGEPIYYYEPEYFNPDLRDYYEFKGWFRTPYYYNQIDFDTETMPADDIMLYAKWEPKTIKVSFFPTYNDYYEGKNRIGDEINVEYGKYVPLNYVPANKEDENLHRPKLDPPAEGAMFAGWYYLRDNIPVRFKPEDVPVTALNQEAAHDGKFQLFAEWVTKDVAKYQIKYVEKGNHNNEVADPTTGRAFVYKTKTFNAKGGDELNDAHKWVEGGRNWWPTTNSHSLLIKSNKQGEEFKPNEYPFEYIQKDSVYYTVRYLDKDTMAPLEESVTRQSTDASVKEDALFIAGYVAEEATKTLVLAASDASTEAEQMTDELAHNVITFYYNKNDTEYLYGVEYYTQDLDGEGYTLDNSENLTVKIAEEPNPTTVSIASLYSKQFPQLYIEQGFALATGQTKVVELNGVTNEYSVADDATVTISPAHRTVIQIYFNRNIYNYSYQYIDYTAERKYNAAEDKTGLWNGVMEEHLNAGSGKVEEKITIPAPSNYDYDHDNNELTSAIPYTRIDNKPIKVTIAPDNANRNINLVKIYYKKFTEREMNFKLVCSNESSPYTEVDYDPVTHDPLYGGLSMTHQTIESYNDIADVSFYDFNNVTNPGVAENAPPAEKYVHLHRYTFHGWYDNPQGTGVPLTTNAILTKEDLGLDKDLPEDKVTYYAVVTQDLVTANFEFRYVESALPADDADATEIVMNAPTDPDGSKTGGSFNFSAPSTYVNNTPVPWHRTDGYSMEIIPKDNRVYKYEFAEWWEEDYTDNNTFVRKKNWNSSGEWSPTILQNQVTRNGNKHIIAVYKRRNFDEMPYTIRYRFDTRAHGTKDFVVNGTLSPENLNENNEASLVTAAGNVELTDDFIMQNAPYEGNYGQTLVWTDKKISKESYKGDPDSSNDEEKVDRVLTVVTAKQNTKKVHVNYKLEPDGVFESFETTLGANRRSDSRIRALDARERTYGGKKFSFWEIRKSENPQDKVVARCYDPWFTFCIMDDYYITPVYASDDDGSYDGWSSEIMLTKLGYNRNRWTDESENPAPLTSGSSDLLYTDYEIAFDNNDIELFRNNTDYEVGVVYEVCAVLPDDATFNETRDYGFVSDETQLKDAIDKKSSFYYYKSGKRRSIQVSTIPVENLTNKNRINFAKSFVNNYTEAGETKTYKNANYVMKVTAYLMDKTNPEAHDITLSNSVYVCLRQVSQKDLAASNGIVVYE